MSDRDAGNRVDAKAAERLVIELIAIRGGSGDERAVAEAIMARCVEAGVPRRAISFDAAHKRSKFGGSCGNLIVKLAGTPGRTREPRRMLMAHMDTVPPCAGARPVKRGRRIVSADVTTALGGDDRAGCATVVTALRTVLRHGLPHPPLTLLFTVQEEVGLYGSRSLDVAKLGRPAAAFNFDGGDPAALVIGATGADRMTIDVTGRAAHAGNHPERGVSAVAIAALAIGELQRDGWHGLVRKGRAAGTSNVGVIRGGEATNVVTDRLSLRAEARSHSPAFRRRIVEAYVRAFERAARHVRSQGGDRGSVAFTVTHDYESFKLAAGEPVVRAAEAAIAATGLTPTHRVTNGGLDANWLNRLGVPTVTLGCGQRDIHMVGEWLHVGDYLAACRIATGLCVGV